MTTQSRIALAAEPHQMTPVRPDDRRWAAVLARDAAHDGRFFYAVRSTGVYCRPSCPSRRPKPESVRFFSTADEAEVAGFRACRRCDPRAGAAPAVGIDQVRKAAAFIAAHSDETITLARLGAHVGLSPFHLQRLFTRMVGISPRAYQDALRAGSFRKDLRNGKQLTGAIYDAGYGSASRVYEQPPTGRGITPTEYLRGAKNMTIAYTVVDSSLGRLLVAGTSKGLCSVKLGDRDDALEADLRREYPNASIERTPKALTSWVKALVAHLDGGRARSLDLPVDVQATAFQWRVWKYLQSIPAGDTRTYSEAAADLGMPKATRAVARACATNHVCLVIPCHRVIQKDGGLGGYRWGVHRKRVLLDRERRRRT